MRSSNGPILVQQSSPAFVQVCRRLPLPEGNLPRPFAEGALLATDYPGLRVHPSSTHCRHHRYIMCSHFSQHQTHQQRRKVHYITNCKAHISLHTRERQIREMWWVEQILIKQGNRYRLLVLFTKYASFPFLP